MNKSSLSSISKIKSTNIGGNVLNGSRREKMIKNFLGNLELNLNATNAQGIDSLARYENYSQDDYYCSKKMNNNEDLENYDEDNEYDNENQSNFDYENDLINDEDEDDEAEQDALDNYDEEEDIVFQVNCNSKIGELFKKKFGSGGKGKCIRVVVKTKVNQEGNEEVEQDEEKWFTPIEFESFCGKANCRDWKKTIRSGGRPLLALIEKRVLICHAVSCSCSVCCENSSINGPIKPLIKMRQRKKSEAKMVNAYKKFLNLKPPTLLFASSNENNHLLNLMNTENSENCYLNPMQFKDAAYEITKASSDQNNEVEEQDEIISNVDSNCDDELISSLRKFQKQQQDQWRSIESSTNILFSEMESLKKRIEDAKHQSNVHMNNLIEKIIETSDNKSSKNCKKRKT